GERLRVTLHYREGFACRDDEPLQRELDRLYEYGDDLATRVLHRCRLNLFARLIASLRARGMIRRSETALDVGCNAGMYSQMLSDAGFARVLGIDVEPEMIGKAIETFGSSSPGRAIEFRLQDAESLDPAQRFDFVLCTEVIEHTRDPDRVIAN